MSKKKLMNTILGRGMAPAIATMSAPPTFSGDTDFIAFIGQSNLTTTGGDSSTAPTPHADAFKATTTSVVALPKDATLLPAFANAYITATGRKIIAMNFAQSGSALLR